MGCGCAECEGMQKELVGNQKVIAEKAPPKDEITGDDFKVLREGKKKLLKGKGERHFYIQNGKPVQWTGETHKHPDGTLMSGKEHKEGESKKLYHFYELKDSALRHLSKETTNID